MNWMEVGALADIPRKGSVLLETKQGNIAVFRSETDEVFALFDQCPHKQGPLSQGIVHGSKVTCPLHNWVIDMQSGEATGPDTGCTHTYDTKVENDIVFISL